MNEVCKAICQRRSIRSYQTTQIPDVEVKMIVECGLYAASSMGKQASKLLVIRDSQWIKELSACNASFTANPQADPFYGAPLLIIVLAAKENEKGKEDGSLIMANLMLSAYSLGIGSCWIHRAKEMIESECGQRLLQTMGIKGEWVGIANCILGYPSQDVKAAPRHEGRVAYL